MLRTLLATALVWLCAVVAHAAPSIEDYAKLPGVEHMALSASGARYAMVATLDGGRRLVIATAANELVDLRSFGSEKIVGLAWAGEDHVLIFVSSTVKLGLDFTTRKQELMGCIVLDLKRKKSFAVFEGVQRRVAKTIEGFYGAAEIGGRWYGYFGGYSYQRTKGGYGDLQTDSDGRLYADLYRVDLDTSSFELAAKGEPGAIDWLVSPAGEVVARAFYFERSGEWRVAGGMGTRS